MVSSRIPDRKTPMGRRAYPEAPRTFTVNALAELAWTWGPSAAPRAGRLRKTGCELWSVFSAAEGRTDEAAKALWVREQCTRGFLSLRGPMTVTRCGRRDTLWAGVGLRRAHAHGSSEGHGTGPAVCFSVRHRGRHRRAASKCVWKVAGATMALQPRFQPMPSPTHGVDTLETSTVGVCVCACACVLADFYVNSYTYVK